MEILLFGRGFSERRRSSTLVNNTSCVHAAADVVDFNHFRTCTHQLESLMSGGRTSKNSPEKQRGVGYL